MARIRATGGGFLRFAEESAPARDLLKVREHCADGEQLRALTKNMKKQKIKKKINKVQPEQREKARFIAESDRDSLELAPQAPLGTENQPELTGFHKD